MHHLCTLFVHKHIAALRIARKVAFSFCRGHSKYRGVTRHHKQGKWEARIGRVKGSKYLYLGTYSSQEEAARAYDEAALKFRGEKVMLADLLLAAAILQWSCDRPGDMHCNDTKTNKCTELLADM